MFSITAGMVPGAGLSLTLRSALEVASLVDEVLGIAGMFLNVKFLDIRLAGKSGYGPWQQLRS